jgi:hypothetical protein
MRQQDEQRLQEDIAAGKVSSDELPDLPLPKLPYVGLYNHTLYIAARGQGCVLMQTSWVVPVPPGHD